MSGERDHGHLTTPDCSPGASNHVRRLCQAWTPGDPDPREEHAEQAISAVDFWGTAARTSSAVPERGVVRTSSLRVRSQPPGVPSTIARTSPSSTDCWRGNLHVGEGTANRADRPFGPARFSRSFPTGYLRTERSASLRSSSARVYAARERDIPAVGELRNGFRKVRDGRAENVAAVSVMRLVPSASRMKR